MTKAEASQLVALIHGAYHNVTPRQQTVEIYEAMLVDLPFAATRDAVIQHIKTSKWMPTIAEIRAIADPPKRELSAPYHRLFDSEPEPKMLPAKVVELANKALRALPEKP